jgi:hypothetical protein
LPPGSSSCSRIARRGRPSRRRGCRRSGRSFELPLRIDTTLLFPSPQGLPLNLDNFRKREWAPAVEAAGIARPARLYDLRSTFASNALHAGVTVFELARVMGTSVWMIERHYGTLVDGAHSAIADRLDRHEADWLEAQADAASSC